MHPCLQTYDIIEQICQELRFSDSLDALAKLAATCHDFMDPALDELWHTILTLEPLVKCLPEDAWTIKNTRYHPLITLTRQTTPADWERCKFYAPRIRQYGSSGLDTTSSKPGTLKGSIPTDRTIYNALKPFPISESVNSNLKSQTLLTLPNLRKCCLQPYSPSTPIPHFRPFLSPNLRSFEFTSPTYDPEEILPGILRQVAKASPLLRSLRIEGVSVIPPLHIAFMHEDELEEGSESESSGSGSDSDYEFAGYGSGFGINRTLSNMLQSLDQLTSLICPLISFPPTAIIHLATRSKIRALHIKNPVSSFIEILEPIFNSNSNPHPNFNANSKSHSTSRTSRIPCFEYLEKLNVDCYEGLSECYRFLSIIDNINDLKELEVGRNGRTPSVEELKEFLERLGYLISNKKLRSLYIHQDLNMGFTTTSSSSALSLSSSSSSSSLETQNPNIITLSTLQPLLNFPFLSEINLILDKPFSFSNSDISIIAKSWSELSCLQFGFPGCGWKVKSKIGLVKGLKEFARWCKKLKILNVVFEFDGDGNEDGDLDCDGSENQCETLQFLDVGNSTYQFDSNSESNSNSNSNSNITKISSFLLNHFPNLKCIYGPDITVSPIWQKKWMEVSKKVNELRVSRNVTVAASTTTTSAGAGTY